MPNCIDSDGGTSLTTVFKTKKCGHVFHEVCLYTWLHTLLKTYSAGTCLKFRQFLMIPHNEMYTDMAQVDLDLEIVVIRPDMDRLYHALYQELMINGGYTRISHTL